MRLFGVAELMELVEGSSRANWLRHWIHELIASHVLVKRGKRFLGSPERIVGALMGAQ